VHSLVRCAACGSRLLQLERVWFLADGRTAAQRRCPECQRRDAVLAEPLAIRAWVRRERRKLAELAAAEAAGGHAAPV
jgi:hypothetical protein